MTRNDINLISIKRRQLMIAAAACAAAPAGAFAARCGGGEVAAAENPFGAGGAGQKLVLSVRILGFGCQPLGGAVIEVWHADAAPVRTTTDADGRFVLTTSAPAGAGADVPYLSYHVTHPSHDLRARALRFTRQTGGAVENVARLERDDAGVWRAAFGLTVA